MQICRKIAGYSYGRADLVRRAMSKKKLDVMEKERHNFIYGLKNEKGETECVGALVNGVSEEMANEIFDEMSNFAKYAFNKSHAAAYAYVSYQTAWLKAHYPCELMAATLTSVLDSSVKVSGYIAECTRIGIRVLAPNINSSFEGFTVKNGQIRFGLLAIKNLGRSFIKTIIDNREQGGKYTSFYTFCKRVYSREFNRRAVESLIKCGACDGLDMNRRQMLYMLPLIIAELDADKNRNVVGQIGFFDEDSGFSFRNEMKAPDLEEMPKNELLAYEKEITGLYISGHPMDEYNKISERLKCDKISDILETGGDFGSKYKDNVNVKILGIVTRAEKKITKNNSTMCFVEVEDIGASIECIVFSKLYADRINHLKTGNILLIRGRLSMREDRAPSVICESIESNPKNLYKDDLQQEKSVIIHCAGSAELLSEKIRILCELFSGTTSLHIQYNGSAEKKKIGSVKWCTKVIDELTYMSESFKFSFQEE